MVAKVLFVFCTTACVVQSALGQCLGRMTTPIAPSRAGLGFDGLGYDGLVKDGLWPKRAGCGAIIPTVELAASYGGGLSVSSSSCAAPTGLAVTSENAYEGPVSVAGNLPFLGTAAMEGVFQTGGTGAISYGCGDGVVAITAEGPFDAAIAPAAITPAALTPAVASWGYKGSLARGGGCGCGGSFLY